tara:strand:+ start:96 stop:344 length:249 start_codon:yes stop_codon:yes gene_type:complete
MIQSKVTHVILLILVIIVAMNFIHIENSYAHSTEKDVIYSEAYFYGIPTFDLDTYEAGPASDKEDSIELENMRRQFWGITIR